MVQPQNSESYVFAKFSAALTMLDLLSIQQRGRRLDQLEREILTKAWENVSYQQIEGFQEQTVKNKAVRLWKYLSELFNTKVNKYNLRQVLEDLDPACLLSERLVSSPTVDRIGRSRFHGRLTELWQLQAWIETQRRRLIFVYGMKGIGKTALVRKLTESLAVKLDRIIWIRLEDTPNLIDVLATVVKELGGGRNAKLSRDLQLAINKTIGYLQKNRCLLVLDDAGLILNQDQLSNADRFEDYLHFFGCLNSATGDSCCLTISTEKCLNIGVDYQQLELRGLDRQSCQILVQNSELVGTLKEWDLLVDRYRGNPQFIKIVSSTISDIFNGNIAKFLAVNLLIYDRIETLLSQQLDQLSNLEMVILLQLAIERKPTNFDRLKTIVNINISAAELAKILDRLVRLYLIDIQDDDFILPDLIMESITTRYHDLICREIATKKLDILHLYPIFKPNCNFNQDQDPVTNSQNHYQQSAYSLLPIINRLIAAGHVTPPPQRCSILNVVRMSTTAK